MCARAFVYVLTGVSHAFYTNTKTGQLRGGAGYSIVGLVGSNGSLNQCMRGPLTSQLLHLAIQVLLSGASAIPPLFFRLVYSPLFSPSPNPASLVPPGPLSHLRVYLHWKLFGADPPTAGGEVEGPPPHDDFTRGAELARIPWVGFGVFCLARRAIGQRCSVTHSSTFQHRNLCRRMMWTMSRPRLISSTFVSLCQGAR